MNGGPISWFSRLQKLVALSTAESEIYAAIDGVKVFAHLQILLHDLGVRDLSPVTTFQDNRACINMVSQLRNHKNPRHCVMRLSLRDGFGRYTGALDPHASHELG